MASNEATVHTDQVTSEDRLAFTPYRDTLVSIIRKAETPLTVGVFGGWGTGKTSLLMMLQDTLRKSKAKPRARLVWFNAWQYGQEAALWRALLSRVLEALRLEEAVKPDSDLDDIQASLYRDVDREVAGRFEVDWDKLAEGTLKGAVKFGLSYVPGARLLEDLGTAAKKKTEEWSDDVLEAFRREKTRIHLDHVRFLEQFRDKFEKLVQKRIIEKGERLVVFVDDLDRCLPEKAIEVLEAIKLFLDVPGCVFVIAVDQKVIEKGIQVRYRDFALHDQGADLPIDGADYLKKIVQVPFYLPPVRKEDMREFIKKVASQLPSGCDEVFAVGMETNARKIKRTLNVFWMHDQMAHHHEKLREVIKPVRLAKVVVVQSRYPELYRDWADAPLLLRHLEERFLAERQRKSTTTARPSIKTRQTETEGTSHEISERLPPELDSESVRKWVNYRSLRDMLLCRAGKPDTGFAGMKQKELEDYIYLTSTATETITQSEVEVDKRLWENLQSNDRTRVESAVGRISEEEHEGYATRLLSVIESSDPAVKRISAGTALGFLGDPRFDGKWHLPSEPLLGFIKIPEGKFTRGSNPEEDRQAHEDERPQHAVHLSAYYIARYPVTVAQFRAFVEESRREYDKDALERPPNHPVVWVSWEDAMAYGNWLTKELHGWKNTPDPLKGLLGEGWRIALPSEAQWEKAARGTDKRLYPWGNEFDSSRCNCAETGIGATSAVGCFPAGASPFGVMDLAGDVWEWCQDWFGKDYYQNSPKENPTGPEKGSGRVARGGCWIDFARRCRSARRHWGDPPVRHDGLGFRVVLVLAH